MKELKAKPKVIQAMTRDGLTLENKATGEVENISSREAEQDYTPEAGGTAEKLLERANDAHDRHKAQKSAKQAAATAAEGDAALHRPSSRLQLTEEERAAPDLQPYIRKADKKADKLDAAHDAIPKKRVVVKKTVYDEAAGKAKSALRFEQQDKGPPKLKPNLAGRPVSEALLFAHGKIHEVEHENVGVEGGHKGEELAERQAGRAIRSSIRHHKLKPYRAAEDAYAALEAELQAYLDNYEATHDYDEYHFDLDSIEHDPYVLISILSALHDGQFTIGEVRSDLQMLFDKQYILTETVVKEVRYRTETQTGTRTVTDPDTGETSTEEYEYEVEVPYDYYICTVMLENFNLSHVPVYIMDEETLSAYSLYMSTLGNRPDLFSGSQYPHASTLKEPTYYDVPPEALEDEQFAAMLKEAEKYIGYPYVWGGSSLSTSFDCSGFISWVINHSGWNVGRLGAQGLYNICTPVSSSQAKPGDLVFFVGTYDTPGVSHVGLYVGNSVMLHCGDPISYTNLNSNYWQSHFYSFWRLP